MSTRYDFGFLLKTYKKDFFRVELLLDTFNKYNVDNIQLVIVAPKEDLKHLHLNERKDIITIDEEIILNGDRFESAVHGMSPGYLNQQVIKLKFWETGIFKYYFCIDSDLIFIKDFYISDFISPNGAPYTFVTSFYDLVSDRHYYHRFWITRKLYFKTICECLDYADSIDFAVHGMITLSSTLLREMRSSFNPVHAGWYKNLISKSPLEFSWYLIWCLKKGHGLNRRESVIKTFHTQKEHLFYLLKGISSYDLKRSYIAVVINSNYAARYSVKKYDVSPIRLLVPTPSGVLRAMLIKLVQVRRKLNKYRVF